MRSSQASYFSLLERLSTESRYSINSATSSENIEVELFDVKNGIIFTTPVKGTEIMPIFKKSYAYNWMRISLPTILNQVCADLLTEREELIKKNGPKTALQIEIIGNFILYLCSSILRNRGMELFTGLEPDKDAWNNFIKSKQNIKLFRLTSNQSDAYINRKLASLFENMPTLCNHDFYQTRKQEMWNNTIHMCETFAKEYQDITFDFKGFEKLLHNCMWCNLFGNNFYLSSENQLVLKRNKKLILVDHCLKVWTSLLSTNKKRVDFIVSNVGVDMFSIFLFAHFLLEYKLTPKVRFHVKPMPWGLSKITFRDVDYMFEFLGTSKNELIQNYNKKFQQYFVSGKMDLGAKNYFWTSPYDFLKMKEIDPALYYELAEAGMLFIQGDNNYRKLVSDMMWDSTEQFITTLRGFQPTNICAFRLIKSDVVCGLKYGVSTTLKNRQRDWKYLARYGVIQFSQTLSCNCEFTQKHEEVAVQPKLSYCQKMKLANLENYKSIE